MTMEKKKKGFAKLESSGMSTVTTTSITAAVVLP